MKWKGGVICSKAKIDDRRMRTNDLLMRTHDLLITLGLTHAKGHKRWSGICTKRKGGVICSKAKIHASSMSTYGLSIT